MNCKITYPFETVLYLHKYENCLCQYGEKVKLSPLVFVWEIFTLKFNPGLAGTRMLFCNILGDAN